MSGSAGLLGSLGDVEPALVSRDPRGRWLGAAVPARHGAEVAARWHRSLVGLREAGDGRRMAAGG